MIAYIKALSYKSLCIRKRYYIKTILELLLPILCYSLVAVIKTKALSDSVVTPFINTTINPVNEKSTLFQSQLQWDILYTPNTTFTTSVMKEVYSDLESEPHIHVILRCQGVNSEKEMEQLFFNEYSNKSLQHNTVYGVVFNESALDSKKLIYKLRNVGKVDWHVDKKFPEFLYPGPNNAADYYILYGFVGLQVAINDAFLKYLGYSPLNFTIQEFPYPAFEADTNFQQLFTNVLPMFTVFGYFILVPYLTSNVTEEKRTGSREWMRLSGVTRQALLFGWVVHSLMTTLPTSLIICSILKINFGGGTVLPNTNFFIVWILTIFFCINSVIFLIACTSFINTPNIASAFGTVLWLFPSVILNEYEQNVGLNFVQKLFVCLFPTMSLNFGYLAISPFESSRQTLSFTNMFTMHVDGGDYMPIGVVFICQILTTIFYILLYFYIDSVRPGKYGLAKPWYFIFKPLLSLFKKKPVLKEVSNRKQDFLCEKITDVPIGLSIQGLKKSFGKFVAVDDVSFDIYKGQITALLGHNGAGKTTLINILTGMFSATSGDVYREDENIFENFSEFQSKLGLCPQHDLLFPFLNVQEHLVFFGMVRGLSRSDAIKDCNEILDLFGIGSKKNFLVEKISGGMKRKLTLSIALVGNPEILVLDEPTSGLDPESRRETWNKLLSLRQNRTIILTTHFMEEADALGDMIAIMDHGKIKCYGSSLFLKKHFGAGYHLTLTCDSNRDEIIKHIYKIIPEVILKAQDDSKIEFSLPPNKSSHFPELFEYLERYQGSSITSMHISCTTMDDVFVSVNQMEGFDAVDNITQEEENLLADRNSESLEGSNEMFTGTRYQPVRNCSLYGVRMSALMKKKILHYYRSLFRIFFYVLLLPVLSIFISSWITKSVLEKTSSVPLGLSLNLYGDSQVLVAKDQGKSNDLSSSFLSVVEEEESNAVLINENVSIINALLRVGEEDEMSYRSSYIIAADFRQQIPNLLYSSIAYHSTPVSISALYSSRFAHEDYNISIFNEPFVFKENVCDAAAVLPFIVAGFWAFSFPAILTFLSGNFYRLHHEERCNSGKLLQFMTGTSPVLYWFSAAVVDVIQLIIFCIPALLFVWAFDFSKLFTQLEQYGVLFILFLSSGWSCMWCSYMMSFLMKTFPSSMSVYLVISYILGNISHTIIYILKYLDFIYTGSNKTVIDFFDNMLLLFPTYSSTSMSYKIITKYTSNYVSSKCDTPSLLGDIFSWDKTNGIYKELTFLSFDWLIFATIIFLIDFGYMQMLFDYLKSFYIGPIRPSHSTSDEDVEKEKSNVSALRSNVMENTEIAVLVDGIGKKYSKSVVGVEDVSFFVRKGQCFGLLGVNGAGKSTTFKMLCGDLRPSKGNAFVLQKSLLHEKSKYQSRIGYCPQVNGIIDCMTGKEMLEFYGALRGLRSNDVMNSVSHWLSVFGMEDLMNKRCGNYSGGNKRKLSTAMALIGDPDVILLDEPTTGVDPIARRKFWVLLSELQNRGQTIILTSHSMDECEAVCDRLTIMVRGQMKCIGNILRLKELYGQGFTVMLKLISSHSDQQIQDLKRIVENKFGANAILRDEHITMLHYQILGNTLKHSTIFKQFEDIKHEVDVIEDYVITETTLEQVFLYFAKM